MALARFLVLTLLVIGLLAGCAFRPSTAGTPAGPKPLVYVALGASDAVGVGAAGPQQSWVADLGAKLPPGSRTINLGISGEKLHGALSDELPVAIDAQPDLVTVWLAVNDLNARVPPESYEQDLDTLLGRLQRETHARVFVGNVPDLSLVPAYGGLDPATVRAAVGQWNVIIARQAARHGATVVDLHAQWQDLAAHPEYVGVDGFHPSAEGYAKLADLFAATILASGGA